MPHTPSRRALLRGLTVSGAAVVGFDPAARSWAVDGSGHGRGLAEIPGLDGTLVIDEASLAAASDDYGHIVHRRPLAVLRPGSVRDVVAMVRFCNTHRLPLAPRGQGHATDGQAQVQGGLVIETSTLADIGPLTPASTTVTVGAGARWSEVAKATLAHGLTPPDVTELQVVTGAGESVLCSPTRHPDLFHAVLAGLGQCAVVVAATLRLLPAPQTVRHYLLPYDDLQTFLDDQRALV